MIIEIQHTGLYKLEENKYKDFISLLDIEEDVLSEMISIHDIGLIPILCLNVIEIKREGKILNEPIDIELGKQRLNALIENNIIQEYENKND